VPGIYVPPNLHRRSHPSLFIAALAFAFVGCAARRPAEHASFDDLAFMVETENVPSYMYTPIGLPATDPPKELMATDSARHDLEAHKINRYCILESRVINMRGQQHTAVLLATNRGQWFADFAYSEEGWYHKLYDTKWRFRWRAGGLGPNLPAQ